MTHVARIRFQPLSLITLVAALCALGLTMNRASAQKGDNAVCGTTGTCTSLVTGIVASPAFVDASVFCPSGGCKKGGTDFCSAVNQALLTLPSGVGGTVDARGINPAGSPNANTCASSPFTSITAPTLATILLPSGTITISTNWVLPDRTRIIGEGNNPTNGTTISVASGYPDSDMIEMGSSSLCSDGVSGQCVGVSVEYVMIQGQGLSGLNGVVNQYSGPASYLDHVNLHEFTGTSLTIEGNATDSGPYSNLAISPSGVCVADSVCVQLGDVNGNPLSTRGLHGLTCTCTTSSGAYGIGLNSSNNTLEDIHFEGFNDGIRVGSLTSSTGTIQTRGNVLLNLNGGDNNVDSMTNIIHVCSPATSSCGSASNTVSDLTILSAYSQNNGSSNPNVIQDDLTSTTIGTSSASTVGMYILGDAMGSSGMDYSRFTTTPSLPTWSAQAPGGSGASSSVACSSGSLFSNMGGISGGGTGHTNYTFYVCKSGFWLKVL